MEYLMKRIVDFRHLSLAFQCTRFDFLAVVVKLEERPAFQIPFFLLAQGVLNDRLRQIVLAITFQSERAQIVDIAADRDCQVVHIV